MEVVDRVEIRMLRTGDEHLLEHLAPEVFDKPISPQLLREFVEDARHHLAIAIDGGVVVGMASGVDYVHPDKPRELWINEVGVASTHRQRGVAARLLRALMAHGRALGCWQAWVLTNRSNTAAMRLYESAGGVIDAEDTTMFTIDLTKK